MHQTICWFPQKCIFESKVVFDVQVKWEGGPHPQSSVRLSVSDSSIAMVADSGLVRGVAVGVVKLRGALQTQDTESPLTFVQVAHRLHLINQDMLLYRLPAI